MSTAAATRQELSPALKITPSDCCELFIPDVNGITPKAREWARENDIKPASTDVTKVALVQIDNQIDFCFPTGSLYVKGAEGDSARICSFIQRNADIITTLVCTLDTHKTWQIFFESILVDQDGNHPDPLTGPIISVDDVKSGKWKISPEAAYAVLNDPAKYMALERHLAHYCEQLESAGKYQLMTWPYHTMLGSVGHALVPAIEEVCHLHDIARGSQTQHEIKGGNPLTENYSPFCPEVLTTPDGKGGTMPIAQRNTAILELLLQHDVVFFAGQAKSHCYAWAVDDLRTQIQQKDPALVDRVYLLEDCTSPVVIPAIDFTDLANQAFERFKDAGMHVVQSTDPVHEYITLE